MSKEQLPHQRPPEDVKSEQNKPDAGRLNYLVLVESLKGNYWYSEMREALGRGALMGDLSSAYQRRVQAGKKYLGLLGLAHAETDDEVDEVEFENLESELERLGLHTDPVELQKQLTDAEQALAWLQGLGEVSVAQVEQLKPEHETLRELDELGKQGNRVAAAVAGEWEKHLRQAWALQAMVNTHRDELDKLQEKASSRGDFSTADQVQAVLNILKSWFSSRT